MNKRHLISFVFCLRAVFFLPFSVYATTIFGPQDFADGWFGVHHSSHSFSADPAAKGQPQGMDAKNPTWNNIRYFYRNVHRSQIIRNGICIQAVTKELIRLHEQINRLLEISESVYRHLQDGWWQFKDT